MDMKNQKKRFGGLTAGALVIFTAGLLLAQDSMAPAPGAATQPGGAGAATQPAVPQVPAPVSVPGGGSGTGPQAGATAIPAGAQVRGDRKIVMNFQNATVDSVLAYLSELGGLTILNDYKIEGRVNVINKQAMTVDEAVDVLNSILKAKGYAGVKTGKTLRIVPLDAAKKATIPVKTGNDPATIAETDEVITQVIPVRFADATQLKRDLSPLIPSYADLSSNTSTNTLIMTDTSANVKRLVQIIRAMDTTVSTVSQVKVYTLKFASASSAARLVQEVFKQDTTSTAGAQNRGGMGGFGRFFGPGGQAGAAATDDGQGKPQTKVVASADDRTNTLVVSAPPDVFPAIDQVLEKLDANPAQDQAVFTYRLKNAQSANVANVINSIFGTTGSTAGRTSTAGNANTRSITGGAGAANTASTSRMGATQGNNLGTFGGGSSSTGQTTSNNRNATTGTTAARTGTTGAGGARLSASASQTAADLSGQVYAVPDADTNSVLIMTASTNFERVKALLSEMDRAVQQVLIKVLIAEVTHSDNKDLGAEFSSLNLKNSRIFTDFGLASVATGGLVAKVVQTDFSATVIALEKIGKLDVLSRPYILASDNQTASITVGQTVPFITNSRTTDTGQTVNTIQYQDIGIILNVTPHINPDGLVTLDVAPEISSIATDLTIPLSDTLNATVFNKRAAQTRVAVVDGQTIVIGGLMQDSKLVDRRQVPWLGDIPILGILFARDKTTKGKTELLIFLTPHVAQDQERLKEISEGEEKNVQEIQKAVEPGKYDQHMDAMRRSKYVAPPPTEPKKEAPAPASTTQETFDSGAGM
jgi:general secretion pathway protein D